MTAVIAATESSPPASPVSVASAVGAPDTPMRTAALGRCRGISAPDAGCAASWDAERRRFFAGPGDRKRGESGKSVSVRVDLGGRGLLKKKTYYHIKTQHA